MKYISTILLILALVITTIPVWADVDYEAEVLHDLNLIEGTGDGYNLGGRLTRAEAATFIVGVLGKTSQVLDHPDKYKNTIFNDVPASEWYAPFVGYCKQNGIVAGTGGGRFEPASYVSEKSFLTMLLQALGYHADVEYNWDSVYQKAYEVGISDDIKDTVRTEDNFLYTRGDVVHAIYNSLDSRFNDKTLILSEFLLREHVCNKNMLKKHNLLKKDAKVTEIKEINIIDEDKIEIVFNEAIYELKMDQISIMSNNRYARIQNIHKKKDHIFEISMDANMYSEHQYILTLKGIMDVYGFVTEDISFEFQGEKKSNVQMPHEFAIVSVTPISNNQIDVRFSRTIDKRATQALLYKFGVVDGVLNEGNFQSIRADVLGEDSSHVLITFMDYKLDPNNHYTLYVRPDFISASGERLRGGEGDKMNFSGSLGEFSELSVENVELVDDHFIKVTFNRPVDSQTALKTSNYSIERISGKNKTNATNVYFYRDEDAIYDDTVMVRFQNILDDEEYNMNIDGVKDIYKNDRIRNYTHSIMGQHFDLDGPQLLEVEAVNQNEVHLIFDEVLSETMSNINIKINNKNYVMDKTVDPNHGNVLIVYVKNSLRLNEDDDYTIMVKRGLADYLGRKTTENQEMDFRGSSEKKPDIYIDNAVLLSPNKIKITFSEPIRQGDLTNMELYKVKYETGAIDRMIFPVSIEDVSDMETIIHLENSYAEGNISVEVQKVHSKSGQFSASDLQIYVQK